MQPHLKKSQGFTLIEVSLVIIVMGILMVGLAPLLLRQHSGTMEARDAVALEDAKTAIINYAITFGGIPDPLVMNTTLWGPTTTSYVTTTVGIMRPSDESLASTYGVPSFGVANWGAYGNQTASLFRLDVNDSLKSYFVTTTAGATSTYGLGDRPTFCQAVNQQMKAVSANQPQICQNSVDRTIVGTTTACTNYSPAAFVLISTGTDRMPNQENDSSGAAALTSNRIYENDKRGINNTPGDSLYDDQVKSYPLSAFARDCREKMGISLETMSCDPGYKYVGSVTNNHTLAVVYTPSVGSAVSVPASGFTAYINTCVSRAATIQIGGTTMLCTVSGVANQPCPLANLDTNIDGRIDFVITGATTATAQ